MEMAEFPLSLEQPGHRDTFFAIGAIKSRFVDKAQYTSGLETLLLGGAAAAIAYMAGTLLKGIT